MNKTAHLSKRIMFVGNFCNVFSCLKETFEADIYWTHNGFNIDDKKTRKILAEYSIQYDVVLIYDYTGKNSQLQLLKEITKLWEDQTRKTGNIIVKGSTLTYRENHNKIGETSDYSALDAYIKLYSKKSSYKNDFKVTNIKIDKIGHEQRPTLEGSVPPQIFISTVQFIIDFPKQSMITEIVIESTN